MLQWQVILLYKVQQLQLISTAQTLAMGDADKIILGDDADLQIYSMIMANL